MQYWLSNSKVRLGLLVNGLYLLSLFLPSHSQVGGRPYARTHEYLPRPPVISGVPAVAVPGPAAGPLKADSYLDRSTGVVTFYLDSEMMLLKSTAGSQLMLSPSFTVSLGDAPNSVLLHFTSFNREQTLSVDSTLFITADGRRVWPARDFGGGAVGDEVPVLPYVTRAEDGRFAEYVGKTIPYEVFAEVVGAKSVTFEVGAYTAKLKPDQLEALRDMHRLWVSSRASDSRP